MENKCWEDMTLEELLEIKERLMNFESNHEYQHEFNNLELIELNIIINSF